MNTRQFVFQPKQIKYHQILRTLIICSRLDCVVRSIWWHLICFGWNAKCWIILKIPVNNRIKLWYILCIVLVLLNTILSIVNFESTTIFAVWFLNYYGTYIYVVHLLYYKKIFQLETIKERKISKYRTKKYFPGNDDK